MLEVSSAKEIRGRVILPPNPDLFALTAIAALTSGKTVTVSPVRRTPLVDLWIGALHGHLAIQPSDDGCTMLAASEPSAEPLRLPLDGLYCRDFVLFCALGLGKTVCFTGPVSDGRCKQWARLVDRAAARLDVFHTDAGTQLHLPADMPVAVPSKGLTQDEIHAYLGLALGRGIDASFETEQVFVSPLRHLAQAFGYTLNVKALTERPSGAIARRILRMAGKKLSGDEGQLFLVQAGFSGRPKAEITVTLPGDDALAALLLAAKGIVQRGNLIIENAPLEPWCTQTLQHVRKMGCAPAVQETGQTSFGSVGMIQLQRFEVVGRKVECRPWFQFAQHVPAIAALALFAKGESLLRGLDDLRLDSPDGLKQLDSCLEALGAHHGEMPDAVVVKGAKQYDGFDNPSPLPAVLGAALAVVGLKCIGKTTVAAEAVTQRWPAFAQMLGDICEFRT